MNLVSFLLHIRFTVYFPLMKHFKVYYLILGRCANVKKKKKSRLWELNPRPPLSILKKRRAAHFRVSQAINAPRQW